MGFQQIENEYEGNGVESQSKADLENGNCQE